MLAMTWSRACSAVSPNHVRNCRPRSSHRREEVDVHRPLELFVVGAEKAAQAQAHGAQVVDQDVEPPMLFERTRDELARPLRCGKVDRDWRYPGQSVQTAGVARASHHARTFRCERAGDSQTNAFAR